MPENRKIHLFYLVSYFPTRVGLTGEEDFNNPFYEMLEKKYHIIASLSKEEIRAKAAPKMMADKFEIVTGASILFRKRFVYDQGDRPLNTTQDTTGQTHLFIQ